MAERHHWALLAALFAFEALGQTSVVVASRSEHRQTLLVGLGMTWYAIAAFMFYWLLRERESVVWVNLTWSVGALVIGACLGIFLEGDVLSANQILALAMGAGSLIIWELDSGLWMTSSSKR